MKLLEYIKMGFKGLQNPKPVVQGIVTNYKLEQGSLEEDQEKEIQRRRDICAGCPFMSENAKQLTGFKTQRTEPFCILCSCPIKTKSSSLSSDCGAKSWNAAHPDKDPLPVRWEAYDK